MSARNRDVGELVEDHVIAATTLERPPERLENDKCPYDAVAADTIAATRVDELVILGTLEITPGTPVEIKSARVAIANGPTKPDRTGRFVLRDGQHDELVELDAAYAFAVYRERPGDVELAAPIVIVPARVVDEIGLTWSNANRSYRIAKLPWDHVMATDHVDELEEAVA